MMRKIIATWAVLQFLAVTGLFAFGLAVGVSEWDHQDGFSVFGFFFGLVVGSVAAVLTLVIPWGVLIITRVIWKLFAGEADGIGETISDLTTSDIAGVASAFHPRTGAVLNVAANIDARKQALNVTVPAAPAHNPVDDERL
jgi:hypothetical protein